MYTRIPNTPLGQSSGAWYGIVGIVLGLLLMVAPALYNVDAPVGHLVLTGLIVAVCGAVSGFGTSYLRTTAVQVFGGLMALAGLWALISPFLFGYPLASPLLRMVVIIGIVTAALAGYGLTNQTPVADTSKTSAQIFTATWKGWLGIPGIVAGLGLIISALLFTGEEQAVLGRNTMLIGAVLLVLSAVGAFGVDYLRKQVLQLIGWLTILLGLWTIIKPFVLSTPRDNPLFVITIITGVVTVLVATYALLTVPPADDEAPLLAELMGSEALRSLDVQLSLFGTVLGLLLLTVAMIMPVDAMSDAISQNAIITGAAIALFSALSILGYRYVRVGLGQLLSGLMALAGIWAIAAAFLLGYATDSVLFGLSIITGIATVLLASYVLVTAPATDNFGAFATDVWRWLQTSVQTLWGQAFDLPRRSE